MVHFYEKFLQVGMTSREPVCGIAHPLLVLAQLLVRYDEKILYIISNHDFQMPVKVQKVKLVLARWTWNAVGKRPAQS